MEKDSFIETGELSSVSKHFEDGLGDCELVDLIKSLKTENESLRDDINKQATLYDDKIKNYNHAVLERDNMINQLKNSLGNCMEQQNHLERELQCQADEFNIEIEKLREDLFGKKLKASSNFGENYRELQAKLVQVQEERAKIVSQLELKITENGQLEQKYKLLVNKNLTAREDHLKEVSDYENKIKIIKKQHLEQINNLSEKHEKEIQTIDENFKISKEQDIEKIKNSLSDQIEKLKFDLDTAQNQEKSAKVEAQELLIKIQHSNENLDASNQNTELLLRDLDTKYKEMIEDLKMQHNDEMISMKSLHEKEIVTITEQFDILEKNHKEDHSHIMESLKEVLDTKDRIQNELSLEKEKFLTASSKLTESQQLLESLQEFCDTLEISNKKLLSQQQQKNAFYNETVTQLESQLLKSNELINESNAQISVLKGELKSEKELKNELNSSLQIANSNLEMCSKELLSVNIIKDSLQNENEIYRSKIEEAKTEANNIILENECLLKEIKAKSLLEERLKELQLKAEETKKNDFYNETIIQLKSQLLKSNEQISVSDAQICVLKAELKSEKELKNELNSLLQISNTNLGTCNKELSSLRIIIDSLQNENEIYQTKLEETKTEIDNLKYKNECLLKEMNDKSLLEMRVKELLLKVDETESLLCNYKEYKNECHILNDKIKKFSENVISHLDPEDLTLIQRSENTLSQFQNEFQVLDSCLNLLLAKYLQTEKLKKQDLTALKEVAFLKTDRDGNKESCNNPNSIKGEDCEKETEDPKIGKVQYSCMSCQTNLPITEDVGFQTCIPDNSSCLIATKTIEEDYLMEEILIFPKRIEKWGSCMDIKDSSDINEWKKKYFDVKFVNKALKNENLTLKKALHDNNVVKKASLVDVENLNQLSVLPMNKNACNSQATEQENRNYIMSHLELLEEKYKQKECEMKNLEVFNTVFRNPEEFILGNQPDVDISNIMQCDENKILTGLRLRLLKVTQQKLNLLMNFKLVSEFVQVLRNENQSLNKVNVKEQSNREEVVDSSEERTTEPAPLPMSILNPASENMCEKILKVELEIQILFIEILKQLLKDKEIDNDVSSAQLNAHEYMRSGIMVFLEKTFKSSALINKVADNVLSEWLRILQVGLTMQELTTLESRSNSVDVLSLLHNIEEQLRNVLNEQLENRKVLKEVENSLITTLENNLHLLNSNEINDHSIPLMIDNRTDGAGSKCGLKISSNPSISKIPGDFHGNDDDDDDDSEESDGRDLNTVRFKGVDYSDNSIDRSNGQILKEFDDITLSFVNQELNEKIKIIETQKNWLMKILQGNQNKITEVCQNHLETLKSSSTNGAELDNMVDYLIDDIKQSLLEETAGIENDYGEFLRQYTHEQSLHSQTHSLTFTELKERIQVALHSNICQVEQNMALENEKVNEFFSGDFSNGRFGERVASMSSFTDLEIQKRILNIITQITLNLLHYYSISQPCTLRLNNVEEDNFETSGAINIGFDKSKYGHGPCFPSNDKFETSENISDDQYHSMGHDDGISPNPLDTTAVSEGMLEDLEKDEQIRKVLNSSCPNLMAALKGKLDEISMIELEREVQEFIISLQASAGMLKIIMAKRADPNDNSITLESGYVPELSQHPNSYFSDTESALICREKPSLQDCLQSLSYDNMAPKDSLDKSSNENYKLGPIENYLDTVEPSNFLDSELKDVNETESCLPVDATLDYTTLKNPEVPKEKQIESMSMKLRELLDQRNLLKKQLHQVNGHLRGELEVKMLVEQEKCHLEECRIKLSKELQEVKDLLELSEHKNKELLKTVAASPSKKQSPMEIKEKVRAILAAKDIEKLGKSELVARVRDLENVLEDLVRSKDEMTESYNITLTDLTQQLDVADRQLKKSRLFLDQQAAERDQEFDILIKDNEKLSTILKEKEALAMQHQNLLKEVSGFEKELLDKNTKLEAAKQEIEDRETDLNRALDKIKDLRDITQSLELQLNSKCLENLQLNEKVQTLIDDLKEKKRLYQDANMQLESMVLDRRPSLLNNFENSNVEFEDSSIGMKDHMLGTHRQVSKSLSEELDGKNEDEQCPNNAQEYSILYAFADLLQRSINMLESLQVTNTSGSTLSDEELSVREQLELSHNATLEESRSLSPSSLEQKLEERFAAFERAAEAAVKYSRDLEMRLKVMKTDYEEVLSERDELHQKLACFSDLKVKLENSATEYNELQQQFSKLKTDLIKTQEKLSVYNVQISELELTNQALKENMETIKHLKDSENSDALKQIKELEAKVKELENIELECNKERKVFENKILELCTERDCLQKQYSEQLIKISSTESRLEDFRRADSPQDHELKMKINSLQDELVKNREEMTLIYRQNEELRYSLKDLKEKLLLRDDELDRINRENCSQPSSLPQTAVDLRLHQIQELKSELTLQKEEIETLNDKLKEEHEKLNMSDNLLKHLLDQKNTEINHLKSEFNSLKPISEMLVPLIYDGHSYMDIFELLKNYLAEGNWHSRVGKSPEVLRKQGAKSPESISNYLTPPVWDVKVNTFGTLNSSVIDEADNCSSVQPSNSSKLSLESIIHHSVEEPPCIRKEIGSSTAAEKKLDEDFRSAQEIIEKKEEEIVMLTNEIEDSAPAHLLSTEIHIYQEKLDAEILRNEIFENEIDQYKEQIECMKAEINSLHETIEYRQSKETKLKEKASKADQIEKELTMLKQVEVTFTQELESAQNDKRKYFDKIKILEESLEKIKMQENNLQKEFRLLEKDIAEKENLLSQQKFTLARKDQEVEELNIQMNNLITKLKDNSTTSEKRLDQAHQMHNSIVHEMNQKNIEREKQLCNEYEERMASQLTDLSMKLAREKSESLKQVRDHYQSLLKEKDCIIEELKKLSLKKRLIGKADSVEELREKLCQELSNSEQLDSSLFSYLEGDHNDHGRRNTSHESSTVSETSNNNESGSVTQRIQKLMRKVLKEGEQVLTQTERLFLEQNRNAIYLTHLNDRSSESPTASYNVTLESQENSAEMNMLSAGKDTQFLLKQISSLQHEMRQREKEASKKMRLLEYCSEQEKCFAEEWHEQMEKEKFENEQLRKQLSTEKSHVFDLTSELTQVRCQLQLLEKQIQNLQQERSSLISQAESIEQRNQDLEEALHDERTNFSRVSSTLNYQRKLATSSTEHQNKLIQELRNTLENERKRVLNLTSQLHATKLSPEIQALHNNTSMSLFNEQSSVFINKEVEAGYSKDKELEMKLQLEEAEINLKTLKEKYNPEKAELLSQLGEEQIKVSQLQKRIVFYESEKETLLKNLHQKIEETRQLKEQLSHLQKDYNLIKSELSILSASRQQDNKKFIQEHDEVHVKYSSALESLHKKDSELIEAKRKLTKCEYECVLAKEKENKLMRDLEAEKEAVKRIGFPTIGRMQNLNEHLELQQKENKELCKSLSRLTDDRQNLKQTIGSLEALVLELREKVACYKSNSTEENFNQINVHAAERTAFEAEKSSLQLALRQLEARNALLCSRLAKREAKPNPMMRPETSDVGLKYMIWKYNRSESYRKALIWQKNYLLTILEGFQKTESQTLQRLTSIAQRAKYFQINYTQNASLISPSCKFRCAALVIISIHRMKYLVKRWQLVKRIGVAAKNSISCSDSDSDSLRGGLLPAASSLDLDIRRPQATRSTANVQDILELNEIQSPMWQITGQTPPTKEGSKKTMGEHRSGIQKNLFDAGVPSNYDDYISRVEHIHTTLGIPSRKP